MAPGKKKGNSFRCKLGEWNHWVNCEPKQKSLFSTKSRWDNSVIHFRVLECLFSLSQIWMWQAQQTTSSSGADRGRSNFWEWLSVSLLRWQLVTTHRTLLFPCLLSSASFFFLHVSLSICHWAKKSWGMCAGITGCACLEKLKLIWGECKAQWIYVRMKNLFYKSMTYWYKRGLNQNWCLEADLIDTLWVC